MVIMCVQWLNLGPTYLAVLQSHRSYRRMKDLIKVLYSLILYNLYDITQM